MIESKLMTEATSFLTSLSNKNVDVSTAFNKLDNWFSNKGKKFDGSYRKTQTSSDNSSVIIIYNVDGVDVDFNIKYDDKNLNK